jgi:hypothetical protein
MKAPAPPQTPANLLTLIEQRYSPAEAKAFGSHELADDELTKIGEAAINVLRASKKAAGACAPMSALWAAFIRDHLGTPVHVVAGNLSIGWKKAYYSRSPELWIRDGFLSSSAAWDGHAWLALPGGVIGDISLFRSAYALPEDHWLRQKIEALFGTGRGAYLGPPSSLVTYEPMIVLTDDEITALVKGWSVTLGA